MRHSCVIASAGGGNIHGMQKTSVTHGLQCRRNRISGCALPRHRAQGSPAACQQVLQCTFAAVLTTTMQLLQNLMRALQTDSAHWYTLSSRESVCPHWLHLPGARCTRAMHTLHSLVARSSADVQESHQRARRGVSEPKLFLVPKQAEQAGAALWRLTAPHFSQERARKHGLQISF